MGNTLSINFQLPEETREEYEKNEFQQIALDKIKQVYKKPIYDPFEVFKLSKTYLKEIIKNLKYEATRLLQFNQDEFAWICVQKQHRQLCGRIRAYEYRLNGGVSGQSITPDDVSRVKEHPIEEFYTGTLRKKGKTLVGLCPFHEEKTGSFTIYMEKNRFVCFGCSEKGDSIDFIRKIQNLTFIEAVKYLVKK